MAAVLAGRGQAADRAAAAPAASPMADITDVYAWMAGSNLNLVMDVSPQDNGTNAFGPDILYAFHLTSKSGLGAPGGTETQVICRFASSTSAQCWVVSGGATKAYVTGDPSNTAGVTSPSGKVRVFAGRRSDPAFFNLSGFNTAMAGFAPQLGVPNITDAAGCPTGVPQDRFGTLRTQLGTGSDSFAASNVMAIVVQIDKALVNTANNTVIAVWGSTHAGA
ncbi:MAG TPA: DUF4331 family protein [Kofleriaceae bacterium]